jgi:hypothetical protein
MVQRGCALQIDYKRRQGVLKMLLSETWCGAGGE